MPWTGIAFGLMLLQVVLSQHGTEGCSEGLRTCFDYFLPREQALGKSAGICDLVADQLDCLTMVRLSCKPGDTGSIDGALQKMQFDYEATPTNCTFTNIGQSPDYAMYQCTKLFGDYRSTITDTSCSLVQAYETYVEGLSTFCAPGNLQNVTIFVNSEKQRLTVEKSCAFPTTPTVLLSGQGVNTSSDPCVAAPVFQSCLQSDVIGVCDASSTSTVSAFASSKQSECDSITTTTLKTSTTGTHTTTPSSVTATPSALSGTTSTTTTSIVPSLQTIASTNKVQIEVTETGPGRLYMEFGGSGSSIRCRLTSLMLCLATSLISNKFVQT